MITQGKTLFGRIFVLSVLSHVCLSFAVANARFVDGHYVIADEDLMLKRSMDYVDRDKRYTDTQERASAFCTGLCMFEEKKPYSYCFDLCNWNGKTPSPWDHHDRSKDSESFKVHNIMYARPMGLPEGLNRASTKLKAGDKKPRNRYNNEN